METTDFQAVTEKINRADVAEDAFLRGFTGER